MRRRFAAVLISLHDVQRKYTSEDEISSLLLNLDMVLRDSTLGGFAYI